MRITLFESKRDNQLQPYLDIYNEKTGRNFNLGQFKSMMLKKLSAEGGMHNLSLSSNFYLVGAVKYYFNGDLTNGDIKIFDDDLLDSWNTTVCQRLDVLIDILRNEYIDTIGTEFTEPEDFGELSIEDLLNKYQNKIDLVMDKDNNSENNVNGSGQASKNYTYDIIWSFDDSSKYRNDTDPGAWCITYGIGNLRSYCKEGNGHFIFFLRNDYKSTERKAEFDKWIPFSYDSYKPQDNYGNSMIAFLQSNDNAGPANYHGGPLITSRWNHGYSDTKPKAVEADRAYTFEEFKDITGVSDETLKEIFKIWRTKKSDIFDDKDDKKAAERQKKIRELKYIQMRLNRGESFMNIRGINFESVPGVTSRNVDKDFKIGGYGDFRFAVDGKTILFDTISENTSAERVGSLFEIFPERWSYRGYLYNPRTHSFVNMGLHSSMFVNLPRHSYDYGGSVSIDATSLIIAEYDFEKFVLISPHNGNVISLPDGTFFFNEFHGYKLYSSACITSLKGLIELMETSGIFTERKKCKQRFFYDVTRKKFVTIPSKVIDGVRIEPRLATSVDMVDAYPIIYSKQKSVNGDRLRRSSRFELYDPNFNEVSISFDFNGSEISLNNAACVDCDSNGNFAIKLGDGVWVYYKKDLKDILRKKDESPYVANEITIVGNLVIFKNNENKYAKIYSNIENKFMINPYKVPNIHSFIFFKQEKNKIVCLVKDIRREDYQKGMYGNEQYLMDANSYAFSIDAQTGEIGDSNDSTRNALRMQMAESDIINMVKQAINEILKKL